jgi:dihydrodipicolinate synthase/N-acetylneuraminate lyase
MAAIDAMRAQLGEGRVIPACPLALNARRRWSECHQAALVRYYQAAGAGGLAVGVHTTQFAIRQPQIGLYQPVLELARGVWRSTSPRPPSKRSTPPGAVAPSTTGILIAGVCGKTSQAVREATLAGQLGYDGALLSLGAWSNAPDKALLQHCRTVAKVLPLIGFYLQPAAGGRLLSYSFWRHFAEIPEVVAIKIAPFNRYQTLDVIRAVIAAGRDDIALYTGNDDNIVLDLLTPFQFEQNGRKIERRIVGGLLGHWAVWTKRAVELHAACRLLARQRAPIPPAWLTTAQEVTDMNAALFDAANQFAGCIAGIHEVLRRQRLLAGTHCLDPDEQLSPGQRAELDRVTRAYPHLLDDAFIAEHRDAWLR